MRRTTILNAKEIKRTPLKEAQSAFYKHCRLKNLTEQTLKYYEEDLSYFRSKVSVKYADEITQEVFEGFLLQELDAGKKVTSLNSRIRGLRVFFNFCTEREYMKPISVKLMKEEETIKETYTDAELLRLLKRPESNSWVEWRTWAAVNYLVATGNRASTVINIKISDVDFDEMTIRLVKVKKPPPTAYPAVSRAERDIDGLSENVGAHSGRLSVSILRRQSAQPEIVPRVYQAIQHLQRRHKDIRSSVPSHLCKELHTCRRRHGAASSPVGTFNDGQDKALCKYLWHRLKA